MKDQATIRMLQQQISELQKQMKVLQNAPALRNASIEDTNIPVLDADGRITSVIGRQQDGSSGVRVVRSPFQPMPTAPTLEAGEQAGTCRAAWDGGTHFGDPVPTIFGKIEIWAVLLGEGEEPFTAPNPGAERVGSIREREGGEVLVALPKVGTWGVWLRMVGADEETTSLWSPASTVDIEGRVDEERIAEVVEEWQGRLDAARDQLDQSMQALDEKLLGLINDKLTYSEDEPPSQYDGADGDVWRVIDPGGVVTAEYERVGGAWEPRTVGTQVIHNLDVGKLVANLGMLNEAVIEQLWAEVVRARFLEADEAIIGGAVIQDDSIAVEKLVVTEQMTGALAEFLVVRAGMLEANFFNGLVMTAPVVQSHEESDTGWKIRVGTGYQAWDTSGAETVRIDGVANFLRGSIHAGVADQAEIHLDYGQKTITTGEDEDGEPEQITTFDTPYIEFRDGTQYVIRPMISLGENGHLLIRPGSLPSTPRYRAPLNIAGDLHVNRVEAREQVRTRNGFRVNTGTVSQPGGVMRDGTRTRLQGRTPADHGPHDTIVEGSIGPFDLDSGSATRGTRTYDAPSETGIRRPILSTHVANTSWGYDSWRTAIASSAAAGASSFRWVLRSNSANAGTVQCWIYYTNIWI